MPKIAKGDRLENVAFDYIKNKITTGEYPTGYRVVEAKLSQELNMSRTPIRRAIINLCHSGFLVHQYNRGAFVQNTEVTITEFFSRMKLVELLMYESVEKLVLREDYVVVDDIIEIAESVIQYEKNREYELMRGAFEDFISIFIGKLNNEYFNRVIQDLWNEINDNATKEVRLIIVSASDRIAEELAHMIAILKSWDYEQLKKCFQHIMNAMILIAF
ncbi:GntR family transcriptional regulator [Listeria monocytogenes]|uniref:GntR family transcriptional regulator n=1 Tax=Listeria monocytogenes TaxID=1639 RepID=A0A6Z2TME8_LISMN|nr:GntR family transcriptional regulator [Listeria monocytogenes]EAC6873166.1 GntR family transcriptional regulator [Listeria monocytogenes]EAC7886441.1 GntR family transcriptional regulator [Listeria monocytogenes]EAC8433433.1 GntR family transcriptional regulator [Listeria monocytogenes]EAC8464619.1 GntR family transcriptional regulator [Listeria monocytogenes]EAD1932255.1 GntR family transcriptional regulator [Listeria monocytogenes]